MDNLLDQAKQRASDLESQLEDKERKIEELQKWAEIRQYHEETLRKCNSDLGVDKNEMRSTLEAANAEIAGLKNKMIAAKNDQTEKNGEINRLRLARLEHSDPAITAAEHQDSELRELKNESAGLKKRVTNLTNEGEYIRQLYQQASEAAVTASAEGDKVPGLEKRLIQQTKERRELINKDENAGLRKEVNNLRETLKQRDSDNRRLHADLEALKRGRAGVQTRGSSVQPRSPRGGSRGVSPAGMLQPGGKALSGLSSRFNDRMNG